MSTQRIPDSSKRLIQSNRGDYEGNVWASFCLDLDSSPGVFRPSKRLSRVLGTSILDDEVVHAITIHDGYYYVITRASAFRCSTNEDPTDSDNWSEVSGFSSEDLGIETDATSFAGLLLVSLGTNIMSWNGSVIDDDWWTAVAGGSALTANLTHTLEVLRTGNDTLFITNGNDVHYYNASAGVTTITLDTLMIASSLTPSLDRMWCGTYTEVEDNAFIYELAVGESLAVQSYPIEGMAALSLFTYKNTPFVITSNGYIQVFNGSGFEVVAQFPWANDSVCMEGVRPGLVQNPAASKAIHPKGVKVKGKYAYIFVDATDEYNGLSTLSKRAASGLWVLDLETYSLTHRYALTDSANDRGTHKVDESGVVLVTNTPQTRIMIGSKVNNVSGVWMETSDQFGYFVTARHESEGVADAFESLVTKSDLLGENDLIEVKYKDEIRPDFPREVLGISWLDANHFTTTDALTEVEEGDEVEIVAGDHAGKLCHIVSITGDTTKTVTVDTSFASLNDTSDIYIDSFKKLNNDHTEASGDREQRGGTEGSSTFRQHKVVMYGDVTLREVMSKSNSKERK